MRGLPWTISLTNFGADSSSDFHFRAQRDNGQTDIHINNKLTDITDHSTQVTATAGEVNNKMTNPSSSHGYFATINM